MAAPAEGSRGKLDIGRVIKDAFRVVGREPLLFFGLAFVFSGLPSAYFQGQRLMMTETAGFPHLSAAMLIGILISIFLSAFLEACLLSAALSVLDGGKPTIGEIVPVGLKLVLPLVALNILFAIAVTVGLVALIVPGVMLAVTLCASQPVLVSERPRVRDAFGRSAQLTRGNRWRILGLFLIYGIASAILQLLLGGALGRAFAGPRVVGEAISSTLISAIGIAGAAALYTQLRELQGAPASTPQAT